LNQAKSITFIGAGNVATHLAKAFFNKGFTINNIYSRSIKNAKELAQSVNSVAVNNLNDLNSSSDIYLICVSDDSIEEVLAKLNLTTGIIAHTSGSIDISVFKDRNIAEYGIFYPLQTFSKNKPVNINEVPFCIEACCESVEEKLSGLAQQVSCSVQYIDSEKRKKLHLAAVFACNFSNHMYSIASELLERDGLDFSILKPLIIETAKKITDNDPRTMQTGPAIRKDEEVIKNHLELLAHSPAYKDIYKKITDNIIKES
jgi:predicted short-subunit dehydrogenase-like oxidoreductase (DUF2520 family)